MREYSVQPEEVRVGGNILEPREGEDFLRFQSMVSVVSGSGSPTSESFLLEFNPLQLDLYIRYGGVDYTDTTIHIGDSVTLRCKVDANGTGLEGKTIKFYSGETLLGSDASDGSGWAELSYTPSVVGGEVISAVYEGDATYGLTYSNVYGLEVLLIPTTVTLSSTSVDSDYTVDVTGTCSVASSTVSLYIDNVLNDSVSVNSSGAFSKSDVYVGRGVHTLTVVFDGDTTHDSSSASVSVGEVATSVTCTVSEPLIAEHSYDYRVVGTSIVTAKVYNQFGVGLPNQQVTIKRNGVTVSSGVTNSNGELSYTYNSIGDGSVTFTGVCGELTGSASIEDYYYYEEEYIDFPIVILNEVVQGVIKPEDGVSIVPAPLSADYQFSLPSNCEITFKMKSNIQGARFLISPASQSDNTRANYSFGSNYRSTGIGAYYRTTSASQWGTDRSLDNNWHTFKFVKNGTSVEALIDGDSQGSKTLSWINSYSDYTFLFWIWANGTLAVKDVKITKL